MDSQWGTKNRRAGGQLKTRATTIKADLEPISRPRVFGYARWRMDWVKVSGELAQDLQAWSASVQDVVNSIGAAGSNPPRVQVVSKKNQEQTWNNPVRK